MNEVQQALGEWLKAAYKNINKAFFVEADLMGYKKERFDSGELHVIHKTMPGKVPGCCLVHYGVKETVKGEEKTTKIIAVEFGLTSYVILAHRKTHILKHNQRLSVLRS